MSSLIQLRVQSISNLIRDLNVRIRRGLDEIKSDVSLDVPYRTNDLLNGREVWAVKLDFGVLPNNSIKIMTIPASITSVWGQPGERWIDVSQSYAYRESDGLSIPLPHVTDVRVTDNSGPQGSIRQIQSNQIEMYLLGNNLCVRTETNRTTFNAVITLRYLLNED